MSFINKLLSIFTGGKTKLPENLDSVDELKAKAQEMVEQHSDTINQVTDKIPGEADDQLVEKAKDALQ